MLTPPSLKDALYYPVTASVLSLSIVITLMDWSGQSVNGLRMDGSIWEKWELWRALTATLIHGNFFHLAFNLYWLWTFGTFVEREFGHLCCVAIYVLLGLGSMLAEFTFLYGGIGLSGIGYGLWGMLWILEKNDIRFMGVVDDQTSWTFIGWFFLCIGLTVTHVMPVANIAHGVGALMGVMLGYAICGQPAQKWNSIAGLVAVTVFVVAGSTVFWPQVNFTEYACVEVEMAGINAYEHKDMTRAVKILEEAIHMRGATAGTWYNLALAYRGAGKIQEAVDAFEHAGQMPDADTDIQKVARELEKVLPKSGTNQ